jgi:predicted TPR repeat methyltransferase
MSSSQDDVAAALLQQAIILHRQNKLDAAQELYRRVLINVPDHFDALHLLGVTERQLGWPASALDLISLAIQISPNQAAAHCNLGAALNDLGRTEEALASYEHAIALKPDYAMALCNSGNALRKLGRPLDAVRRYDHALAIDPAYAEAHCNRAILLQEAGQSVDALEGAERALRSRNRFAEAYAVRGDALQSLHRFDEAVQSYDRALEIEPGQAQMHCSRGTALQRLQRFDDALASYDRAVALQAQYPLAHQYRGNSLRALERVDEAIVAYQLALAQGGDERQIAYALAALGVGAAPAAAPADYVKTLFDGYADHFDQHLVESLGYQMPALLDAAIGRHRSSDQLDTLDMGCGTGLCAPFLRRYSRSLSGIDLSEAMLDQARRRELYDHLECADLTAFLSAGADRFDLIVAADVFVYIGDLSDVFRQAAAALRSNGLFCFSVETGTGPTYTLGASHRYAHSSQYLSTMAANAGFQVLEVEPQIGRLENQNGVAALAVVLRSGKPT